MRISRCVLSVSFFIAAQTAIGQAAFAGAWTQDPGKGLAILSGSYYAAGKRYTNSGHSVSQPTYSQYNLNPYFEYGLRDGLTAIANFDAQRVHTPGNTALNIADTELSVRERLYQDEHFALALEPLIKIPSPQRDTTFPRIGSDHPDAALGLSGGYGFNAWGLHHFVDIDAQYRYRFGLPKDQYRVNVTAGANVTDRWTIMPQLFTTWRASSTPNAVFTESAGDDYDQVRLQLTALYKLTDSANVQFGGFSDVDGKNTGAGNGGLISLWKKF